MRTTECFTVQDKKKYIVISLRHLRTYKDITEFLSMSSHLVMDRHHWTETLKKRLELSSKGRLSIGLGPECLAQSNPTVTVYEHTSEWLTLKYWLKQESLRKINSKQMITFISRKVWISELFQIWLILKVTCIFFSLRQERTTGPVHRKEFSPDV